MLKIFLKTLFILFVAYPQVAFSGNDNLPIGARSAAMANASVSLNDMWSVHHNQAGLAFLTNSSAGIFYESRFLIPELDLKGGAAVMPTKAGIFGMSISSFGFSLYSENKYGIAFARKLGGNFAFGLQMDYLRTAINEGNYENKGILAGEVGIQAKINEYLTLGAHVFNINRAKIADFNNERAPTLFRVGISYLFSPKVLTCFELEKDIDFQPVVKAGMEYQVADILYLRTGISTRPFVNTFGFGLEMKHFKIDFASSIHSVLGYSPQVGIIYEFDK